MKIYYTLVLLLALSVLSAQRASSTLQQSKKRVSAAELLMELDIRVIDQSTRQAIYVNRYNLEGSVSSGDDSSNNRGIDFQYSGQANIYS